MAKSFNKWFLKLVALLLFPGVISGVKLSITSFCFIIE